MTIIFAGKTYPCEKAVRAGTTATLCLEDGSSVKFEGVNSWDAFTLEGGEWSLPEVTAEEQMRADLDFLAAMTGVSL